MSDGLSAAETHRVQLARTVLDPVRMWILERCECVDTEVSVDQLSEELATQMPESDAGGDADAHRVSLAHVELPKLADIGLIEYNHERQWPATTRSTRWTRSFTRDVISSTQSTERSLTGTASPNPTEYSEMSDSGQNSRVDNYVTEFSPERETLVVDIVEAVAHACETDERNLPPLHDSIDTDALTRIVRPVPSRSAGVGHAAVVFEYNGLLVTVTRSGTIVVRRGNETPVTEIGSLVDGLMRVRETQTVDGHEVSRAPDDLEVLSLRSDEQARRSLADPLGRIDAYTRARRYQQSSRLSREIFSRVDLSPRVQKQ